MLSCSEAVVWNDAIVLEQWDVVDCIVYSGVGGQLLFEVRQCLYQVLN